MKNSSVYVTDHALVRYFERIVGIEMPKGRLGDREMLQALAETGIYVERARRTLGRNRVLQAAADVGASAAEVCGARFVLQGKTVVTVELPVWKHYACGVAPQSKAEYRRQARRAGAPV